MLIVYSLVHFFICARDLPLTQFCGATGEQLLPVHVLCCCMSWPMWAGRVTRNAELLQGNTRSIGVPRNHEIRRHFCHLRHHIKRVHCSFTSAKCCWPELNPLQAVLSHCTSAGPSLCGELFCRSFLQRLSEAFNASVIPSWEITNQNKDL